MIAQILMKAEELLQENDGLVRAANTITAEGKTNRPTAKLISLEPERRATTRSQNKVRNWVVKLDTPPPLPKDVMD